MVLIPATLPNLLESVTACRIKVASTTTSYADTSDANFTITAEPNYLTLTTPNGGENWPEQSTHNITWNYSGDVGNNVSLHYSLDGGSTWTQIVASIANDGSYPWILPGVTEDQTACRVKVASTSTSHYDISNNNFTITNLVAVLVCSYDTPGDARGVFVSGSYAYVADGYSGLQVINVSNPASPTLAGSRDTPGYALGVFVSGSYAYVADNGSLLIFDISGLP